MPGTNGAPSVLGTAKNLAILPPFFAVRFASLRFQTSPLVHAGNSVIPLRQPANTRIMLVLVWVN